jgi:membrane associated rhomboid family serine protease
LGRLRYVVLYVLAGIGGSLLTTGFAPTLEQAAGASGAIFGLFGAFYIVARHRNLQTGPIVATIAINLVFSFTFSNIDWRGHVGGLITGVLIALVYVYAPAGQRRAQLQAVGVAVVALVMAALGALAVHHVRHECPILETHNGVPVRVGCLAGTSE